MKKIWNWLNGKKTIIGTIWGVIVGYLQIKGYLGIEEFVALSTIGGLIFGTGIVHKIKKHIDK